MASVLARRAVDALVVALAVAAQVEVWLDEAQVPRAVTAPAALLWTLPLLLRSRFPLGGPAAVLATIGVESVVAGDSVTHSQLNVIPILAAFAIVGAHPDFRAAVTGAVIGFASIAAIVVSDRPGPSEWISVLVFVGLAWGIGRTIAERGRRAATLEARALELEREHERAVAGERATIARELHDVIAHSVSVMTVQAGAARLLLDGDPARARESLLAVEETGRQALGEMRRLLGILRGDERQTALSPQPGISKLDALVEHVRAAGLPVELVVTGEPRPLAPGIDLAAYRVVQEALTNALKHAGAARAEVAIRYEPHGLQLAVTNDGRARRNGRPGHGLVGMRERVALYGGELEAGPRDEGGYGVRATFPLEPAAP